MTEKNETNENFPVAQLIRPRFRPHVMAFYDFVRAGDEISDDPLLEPAEKVKRLDAFGVALLDKNANSNHVVVTLRDSLKLTGVCPQHALDLLTAFKQDATKTRYENWEELLEYCRYSANPVGRYMLELHGVGETSWEANDALCTVLQITNHLQDCGDDYRELDRVYIPLDMMGQYGTSPQELVYEKATPALRDTLDAVLNILDPLVKKGHELHKHVPDTMLKIDTSVIAVLADYMVRSLRKNDPLCQRTKPSKPAKVRALIIGSVRAFL